MRYSLPSLLALATCVSQASAYWLVASTITGFGGPVGEDGYHWVRGDDLECDTLTNSPFSVNDSEDVSGDKLGVRVEWEEGDCNPDNDWLGNQCPTVAEQHFSDFHHTWYADRDGAIVRLDGVVVGSCRVDMGTDKQCDVTAGVVRYQSLLECTLTG